MTTIRTQLESLPEVQESAARMRRDDGLDSLRAIRNAEITKLERRKTILHQAILWNEDQIRLIKERISDMKIEIININQRLEREEGKRG